MIINDDQIRRYCEDAETPMISPFASHQIRRGPTGVVAISSGLSSYGYDISLAASGLKRFVQPQKDFPYTPIEGERPRLSRPLIDPKEFSEFDCLLSLSVERDETGTFYTLPARAYALGVSVETFQIPDNVLGICYCKSTYARCGLMVNTTPLEPGWRSQLVLELANLTDLPMKIYANEGIAQVVFFTGDVPSVTYADRAGKYQDQQGIVTARI